MKVYKKSVGILQDNEESYILLLSGAIESIDEFSTMVIVKNPSTFQFKINPSLAIKIPGIIKEINKVNNLFGIKVDFSKSMKSSATIDFTINV